MPRFVVGDEVVLPTGRQGTISDAIACASGNVVFMVDTTLMSGRIVSVGAYVEDLRHA